LRLVFGFGLWLYGLLRTGFRFFYLMIFVAGFGIVLSIVNTLIYYDPLFFIHRLGQRVYGLVFYTYIYSLLLNFILSLIGSTLIVLWICKAHERRKEHQAV
jgi:Cu/Ag efflux pump CusA